MIKSTRFFAGMLILVLAGCSGSETYRGVWKATDVEGQEFQIVFEAKKFTLQGGEKKESYDYTQNAVSIENSVETYGIKLSDGRKYRIHFPIADNETKGIIQDESGNPLYAISRKDYISYQDLYKLK